MHLTANDMEQLVNNPPAPYIGITFVLNDPSRSGQSFVRIIRAAIPDLIAVNIDNEDETFYCGDTTVELFIREYSPTIRVSSLNRHPHVNNEDNELCTGDFKYDITNAWEHEEIDTLLALIATILGMINKDTWYRNPWALECGCPPNHEKHCVNCQEAYCGYCDSNCGHCCPHCNSSECSICRILLCEDCTAEITRCSSCHRIICKDCINNIKSCHQCGQIGCSLCIPTVCTSCDRPLCSDCGTNCVRCRSRVCSGCIVVSCREHGVSCRRCTPTCELTSGPMCWHVNHCIECRHICPHRQFTIEDAQLQAERQRHQSWLRLRLFAANGDIHVCSLCDTRRQHCNTNDCSLPRFLQFIESNQLIEELPPNAMQRVMNLENF